MWTVVAFNIVLFVFFAISFVRPFTARRHGVWVTPPYFIPAPFALGTFGAFIRIKSLSPDRPRHIDLAVAGPLTGLAFAIPALLIGLRQSRIVIENAPPDVLHTGMQIGSSFLMAIMAKLALGASTLEGHQVILHPLAFAGWLGLLVTALNLLPIAILIPVPHALYPTFGIHCPYL
jgi:membrane-associated protease RseP (regulator of RpoE activity)